jgi:hypothetical protein
LVSAGAVVVLLLGLCVVKYWPSNDGPHYSRAGDDLCAKLPFSLFEPTLGSLGDEPAPSDVDANAVGCRAAYGPAVTMAVLVGFADSPGKAEEEYYSLRSAFMEKDSWDLSLPVRKAQWSLGESQVRGSVLDGNMVVVISIFIPGTFGTIDASFGQPMTAFLRAILDEVRKSQSGQRLT